MAVLALMVSTALFLHSRSHAESNPPSSPLASFPLQVGEWRGSDVPIPQWALEVLGNGQFVERSFRRAPSEFPVDFFLAYFPTQRTGSTMHSPQNCLPGSGWVPLDSSRMDLAIPGEGMHRVNRYILTKGMNRMLVLYWYQEHGRAVASEYWAKIYLVADAIRLNRSDGALVRFMTPIGQDESEHDAQQRCVALIKELLHVLPQYVPN